ncbi:hypothetical protein ACHAPO_007995 [Fusarium lateritium]
MPTDRAGFKDANNLAKSKLRGQVRFPPHEHLDEVALQEIRRHRVTPFGNIHETCLHIPYNSGKKDFFEKTGRESFEVFKYEFISLEHGTEYAVMWDYNIGLVRMTPFFKCRGYGKATAQGYWMPYRCAKAICATFCHPIAGALIPIFGPGFPAMCVPPGMPEYGRMVINQQIIVDATREAEIWRMQMTVIPPKFHSPTSFPRDDRTLQQSIYPPEEHRRRHRPRLVCDPSWAMESDTDRHYMSAPNSASSTGSGLHGYMVTSRPGSSWTPANRPSPEPNPWLSAIPRNPPLHHEPTLPHPAWGPKRRLENEEWRHNYRASTSPNMSTSSVMMAATPEASPMRQRVVRGPTIGTDPVQQSAALLLLNLRQQEQEVSVSSAVISPPSITMGNSIEEHRSKRQRATSP